MTETCLNGTYAGWFVGQGQDEKAREILAKYHSQDDADSAIVRLQMKEMKEVIEVESGTDKRQVFNNFGSSPVSLINLIIQVVGYPRSFTH